MQFGEEVFDETPEALAGNIDSQMAKALKAASSKLGEFTGLLDPDSESTGRKRKREVKTESNVAKRQKIDPASKKVEPARTKPAVNVEEVTDDLRTSPTAKSIDENITRILRANSCCQGLGTLKRKLNARVWNEFEKQHPGVGLKTVLESFGERYSFEIRNKTTKVYLNPPLGMEPNFGYYGPPQWGFAGTPFAPFGNPESIFTQQKRPPKPKAKPVRCEICDKQFNSQKVYDNHIAGRKHAKKVKQVEAEKAAKAAKVKKEAPAATKTAATTSKNGVCPPAAAKTKVTKPKEVIKVKTRSAPAKKEQKVAKTEVPTVPVKATKTEVPTVPVKAKFKPEDIEYKPKTPHAQIFLPYTCFVCDVLVNSQQTEKLHINGKKHKKALIMAAKRANGELPPAKAKAPEEKKKCRRASKKKDDFAKYSCEYCKVEITSKKMEETHIAGKKHLRKKRASVQQDVQSSFQDIQPNKVSNDIWQGVNQARRRAVSFAPKVPFAPKAFINKYFGVVQKNFGGVHSRAQRSVFTEFDTYGQPKPSNVW